MMNDRPGDVGNDRASGNPPEPLAVDPTSDRPVYKQIADWLDENLAAEASLERVARKCATDPNWQAAMAQQQAAVSGG